MLTVEEELCILEAAPPSSGGHDPLSQTGGRTYSEGFSLRWDQVDFENKLIRLDNDVKTPGSAETGSVVRVCVRSFASMEQGAGLQESVCLPEPASA